MEPTTETSEKEAFSTAIKDMFHKRREYPSCTSFRVIASLPLLPSLTLRDGPGGDPALLIPIPLVDPFFSLVEPHLRALSHPSQPSHSYHLPPENFYCDIHNWDKKIQETVYDIMKCMNVEGTVKPVVQQLIVQTEGCQHLPALDRTLPPAFGSLIVQFPSIFEGGEISSPQEGTMSIQSPEWERRDKRNQFLCSVFLFDQPLEMEPLTQGYRVFVLYSLHWESENERPMPSMASLVRRRLQFEEVVPLYNKEIVYLNLVPFTKESDHSHRLGLARLEGADAGFAIELERTIREHNAPFQLILVDAKMKKTTNNGPDSEGCYRKSIHYNTQTSDGVSLEYSFLQDLQALDWSPKSRKTKMLDDDFQKKTTSRTASMLVIFPVVEGHLLKLLQWGQYDYVNDLAHQIKEGQLTKAQVAERFLPYLELGRASLPPQCCSDQDFNQKEAYWEEMFQIVTFLGDMQVANRLLQITVGFQYAPDEMPHFLSIFHLLDWNLEEAHAYMGPVLEPSLDEGWCVLSHIIPFSTSQRLPALQVWVDEWKQRLLRTRSMKENEFTPSELIRICSVSSNPREDVHCCLQKYMRERMCEEQFARQRIEEAIVTTPGWEDWLQTERLENLKRFADTLEPSTKAEQFCFYLCAIDELPMRDELAVPAITLLTNTDRFERQLVLVGCSHLTASYMETLAQLQLNVLREMHLILRRQDPPIPASVSSSYPHAQEIQHLLRTENQYPYRPLDSKCRRYAMEFSLTFFSRDSDTVDISKPSFPTLKRKILVEYNTRDYAVLRSLYPHVQETNQVVSSNQWEFS